MEVIRGDQTWDFLVVLVYITRELPGERNDARNNARCTQARKTTHSLDRQHQVVDRTLWKSQSE